MKLPARECYARCRATPTPPPRTAHCADIQFDIKSRDDIPQLLRGLQYIYVNEALRTAVFSVLQDHIQADKSHANGRPGMSLWNILVISSEDFRQAHDKHSAATIATSFLKPLERFDELVQQLATPPDISKRVIFGGDRGAKKIECGNRQLESAAQTIMVIVICNGFESNRNLWHLFEQWSANKPLNRTTIEIAYRINRNRHCQPIGLRCSLSL